MSWMFSYIKAPTLNLGSFDTSSVTDLSNMFSSSTTKDVYTRSQNDLNKFKSSSSLPSTINFSVKTT